MPEFKRGESVIFYPGKGAGEGGLALPVQAVIEKVDREYEGITYEEPLFTIRWASTGYAVVPASQLSRPAA